MYVGYAYTDSTSGNINDEPTLVIVDEGFYLFFSVLLKYGIRRINDPYQNEVNIDYVKIDWIWQPLEIVDDKGQKVTFDYVTDNNQLNTTIHFQMVFCAG